jgi:predicted dehydrogenase
MSDRVIKYGIVGCGIHAVRGHYRPGKCVEGLKLVGICDTKPEAITTFMEDGDCLLAIQKTSNFEELLANQDIDAVIIATPDAFHLSQLEMTLEAGKHVLVEKPVIIDPDCIHNLPRLAARARDKGLVLTSCHPRRFNPPFLRLKSRTEEFRESFGQVLCFTYDYSSFRLPTKPGRHSFLLDHLSHDIDMLSCLYGYSSVQSAQVEFDGPDRYLVSGRRGEDGIAFLFLGTRCLHKGSRARESVIVRHERGTVTLNANSGEVRVSDHRTQLDAVETWERADYSACRVQVMQNFADAIRGKANNYLTADDLWLNNSLPLELMEHGQIPH